MSLGTTTVLENFEMAGYVRQLTRIAYGLYDKHDADKITKWISIGYKKLKKSSADGLTTKRWQLEIYLRSNEHTQGFMDLIDEKGLI